MSEKGTKDGFSLEMEKQKSFRLEKFLKEHPSWKSQSLRSFKILKRREELTAKRLEVNRLVAEMRFKNKLTFQEIGKRFGVSWQAIQQRINRFRSSGYCDMIQGNGNGEKIPSSQ